MDTVCKHNKCNGCMACKVICTKKAIEICDETQALNAYINEEKCVNCGLCKMKCPQNSKPELIPPIQWWQGWTKDEKIRYNSSSGGVASELIRSFISSGGYVCSCIFKHGEFVFEMTNDISKAYIFAGSKYVKSNPGEIYKEIEKHLKNGDKVLFIGLPCQSAGLKKYIPEKLQKELYSIDLICHGTPSYSLLNRHIQELGYKFDKIERISFRDKSGYNLCFPQIKDKSVVKDIYLMGFLSGIFFTENCYECTYAGIDRISDITLGDSWGSDLKGELNKGLSLILCQTQKGIDLIKSSNIQLESVDIEKAINFNQQLKHPSIKNEKTERFFSVYKKTNRFGLSFFVVEPKIVFKQQVKHLLNKLHLYKQKNGSV